MVTLNLAPLAQWHGPPGLALLGCAAVSARAPASGVTQIWTGTRLRQAISWVRLASYLTALCLGLFLSHKGAGNSTDPWGDDNYRHMHEKHKGQRLHAGHGWLMGALLGQQGHCSPSLLQSVPLTDQNQNGGPQCRVNSRSLRSTGSQSSQCSGATC